MRCPYCKTDNDRVVDSRASADGSAIRRRRLCRDCGRRYTTYERVEGSGLRVVKKSGARVDFERGKVMAGVLRACQKRHVATERLEALVDSVERQCMEAFDKEVPSKVIGELIMEQLRGLDQVAYVRFASVYRDFKDVGQFQAELQRILGAESARVGQDVASDTGPGDSEEPSAGLSPSLAAPRPRGVDEDTEPVPDREA